MAIRYLSGINVDSNTLFVDDANNRVGIGTGSPTTTLDVVGSSTTSVDIAHFANSNQVAKIKLSLDGLGSSFISMLDAGNSEDIRLSTQSSSWINAGNVGIGTTSPSEKLDVYGAIKLSGQVANVVTNGIAHHTNGYVYFTGGTAGAAMGNDSYSSAIYAVDNGSLELYAGSANRLHITSAGNVGIGTTSPTRKLDVNGQLRTDNLLVNAGTGGRSTYVTISAANSSAEPALQFSNSASTLARIGGISGGGLYFENATTELMRINNAGNVGIGTTAPLAKVDISAGQEDVDLVVRNAGGGHRAGIALYGGTVDISRIWQDDGDSAKLHIGYSSAYNTTLTPRITMTTSGNVGIGTTSPSERLHVSGKIHQNNGGSLYLDANATNTILASVGARDVVFEVNSANRLIIGSSGSIRLNNYGSGSKTGTVAYNLAVDSSGNVIETSGGVVDGSGTANYVSKWSDANTLTNSVLYDDGTNVGIGTTSPLSKLQVRAGLDQNFRVASSTNLTVASINDADSAYAPITFRASTFDFQNGNVGIGTTAPSYKLDISTAQSIRVTGASTGYTQGSIIFQSSTTDNPGARGLGVYLFNEGTDATWFYGTGYGAGDTFLINRKSGATYQVSAAAPAESSNFFAITNAGNVGIGTTSPNSKLAVRGGFISSGADDSNYAFIGADGSGVGYAGTFTNNNFQLRVNNSARLTIDTSGNVGIGTTSPTTGKLVISQTGGTQLHLVSGDSVGSTDVLLKMTSSMDFRGRGILMTYPSSTGDWFAGVPYTGGAYAIGYSATQPEYTANAKLLITAAGNVGIGQTSPSSRIDVLTPASATGRIDAFNSLHAGNNTLKISHFGQSHPSAPRVNQIAVLNAEQHLHLVTDSDANVNAGTSTLGIMIRSGGNVGIGTTAPTTKLHVTGVTQIAESGNSAFYGGNYVRVFNDQNFNIRNVSGTTVANISVSGNSYFNGGNVGIGTTSPVANLQVGSVTTSVYSLAVGKVDIIDTNKDITDTQMGTLNITSTSRSGVSPFNQGFGPSITFTQNGSGYVNGYERVIGGIKTEIKNAVNLNFASIMQFYTHNNTGLSPRMTIDGSNGNVGIGTTSPSDTLDLYQAANTTAIRLTSAGVGSKIYRLTSQLIGVSNAGFGIQNATDGRYELAIDGSGNVGIGTTSPVQKFQVDGNIYSNGGNIYINGDKSFVAVGNMKFETWDGSAYGERLRITAAGNVGIGTTSPATKFHVSSAGSITGRFSNTATSVNTEIGVSGGLGYVGTQSANAFGIITSDTERIRVTSDGNVGIGTTSPQSKVQISYESDHTTGDISVNKSALDLYNTLASDTDEKGSIITFSDNYFDGNYQKTTRAAIKGGTDQTGNTAAGFLAFYTDSSSANSATERMRITSAGNVGIGTTSPTVKLQVDNNSHNYIQVNSSVANVQTAINVTNSSSTSRATLSWEDGTRGAYADLYSSTYLSITTQSSEKMRITSAGNIFFNATSAVSFETFGVAHQWSRFYTTSSTDYALVDVGNATTRVRIGVDSSSGGSLATGTSAYASYVGSSGAYPLQLGSYGGVGITINSSNNVGIGTASPSQALHVSGSARVTGAYYDSSNSAGSSGQVLSSTGSGTAWVNQGEATATSLFDLLPAARVTYAWSVQLTAGTWADIFSSTTVLSNGTWMVQAYVDDYAVGGQQYQETYSGVMSWGSANNTNQGGNQAISEIVLHRSGHAANAGNFYLRTVERVTSTLLFQGMSNLSHTAATTINFKFVKIF